jgi:hypothetical protein
VNSPPSSPPPERPSLRTSFSSPVASASWSFPARIRAARPRSPGPSASCTTWRALAARCPAARPGCSLFDKILTHFEREEDIANQAGKLEDDLLRIQRALLAATPSSIVIMNEIFASTTLSDARFLGEKVLTRVIDLDLLCLYVTFVDELASQGLTVVSMASTVVPGNPAERPTRSCASRPTGSPTRWRSRTSTW